MKMKRRTKQSFVMSAMLYGSETSSLRENEMISLRKTESNVWC